MLKTTFKPTGYSILLTGTFLTGITLLLIQYFFNKSLWLDEAMLAFSIVDRNYIELLRPLDYNQVAPVLFLWIEKFCTQLLGNGEMGLRLFPLLGAVASLFLFYHLVLSLTENRIIALIALFMLAVTPKFLYYGTEVKQYATDLFTLLLVYGVYFIKHPLLQRRRVLLLSITGALAVFLSNVAVIPLLTAGLMILYRMYREKKERLPYLAPLATWFVCFVVNYYFFIYHHPAEPSMKAYWQDSFMPLHPFPMAAVNWLMPRINNIFYYLLPVPDLPRFLKYSIYLFIISVFILLFKRKWLLLYICFFPVAVHLLLSALTIYPFDIRLILYQLPLYLLVICYGLYMLSCLFIRLPVVQYLLLTAVTLVCVYRLYDRFPVAYEEIRPCIQYINRNIEPSHTVYVYAGSIPAAKYYQKIGMIQFGQAHIIPGRSHIGHNEEYLKDLESLHGPVWILISHFYPFDGSRAEEKYILNGLKQRGTLLKEFQAPGSAAYLFNLQ
jgi:hypothetical protein